MFLPGNEDCRVNSKAASLDMIPENLNQKFLLALGECFVFALFLCFECQRCNPRSRKIVHSFKMVELFNLYLLLNVILFPKWF